MKNLLLHYLHRARALLPGYHAPLLYPLPLLPHVVFAIISGRQRAVLRPTLLAPGSRAAETDGRIRRNDLLWVQEMQTVRADDPARYVRADLTVATAAAQKMKVLPAAAMDWHRSRVTLRVKSVRHKRLHDLTDGELAELGWTYAAERLGGRVANPFGRPEDFFYSDNPRRLLRQFWALDPAQRLAADGAFAWERNPWVHLIGFEPVYENVLKVANRTR